MPRPRDPAFDGSRPMSKPLNEVRGLPLLGVLPWMLRDAPGYVLRQVRERGTPLRLALGRGGIVVIAEPDQVRQVLLEDWREYPRGRSVDLVRPLLGDGLPLADGAPWLRRRRMLQPAFGPAQLDAMVPVIARVAARHVDRLEPGSRFRAHDLFMRLTLETVLETMFSESGALISGDLVGALQAIERYVGRYSFLPFSIPLWLPTPDNRRFRRAVAALDETVFELIERRRRAGGSGPADLLGALLAARDPETGEGLTDRELRDEVLNIFYAGHETTANALTWITYLLSTHPDVASELRRELSSTLGERPPAASDLPRLRFAGAVVREALRLYPPAWMFARTALRDAVVGGARIPRGTVVIIAPFVTHRLEELWPNPDQFDPQRFLADPPIDLGGAPSFTYIPFGGGPHQCIGNQLAVNEAVIVLATMLPRIQLRVEAPERVRPRASVTLGAGGGLPVIAERAGIA